MTETLPSTGLCRCGAARPCGCEWAEYGRYGIDSTYPGHPDSGRCLRCKTEIPGRPLRVGKWIYCDSRCFDAGLYSVPVLETTDGGVYLPGDVLERAVQSAVTGQCYAQGSAYYPAGWSR